MRVILTAVDRMRDCDEEMRYVESGSGSGYVTGRRMKNEHQVAIRLGEGDVRQIFPSTILAPRFRGLASSPLSSAPRLSCPSPSPPTERLHVRASSNTRVGVIEAACSRDVMAWEPSGPVVDNVLKPLRFSAQVGTVAGRAIHHFCESGTDRTQAWQDSPEGAFMGCFAHRTHTLSEGLLEFLAFTMERALSVSRPSRCLFTLTERSSHETPVPRKYTPG